MADGINQLVSTEWLEEHLVDSSVRIVDIRGYVKKQDLGNGRQEAAYLAAKDEYDEAHIPGAVYVDWTRDITDPYDQIPVQLAPPSRFARLMGFLGIDDDTHVIIYDHLGAQFATRLWWALMYYGHERVSVLNGGWKKWTAEGRPVTAEVVKPKPANFTPRPRPGWRADTRSVLAASENGRAFILDARDEGQYTGAVVRGDGRPGRVPGARHLHADTLLDPSDGGFRSTDELVQMLREAGAPEDKLQPVVAYCNGGVAATVLLFTLYRMGYKNLANYDGSWNEWGIHEDVPVERGAEGPSSS